MTGPLALLAAGLALLLVAWLLRRGSGVPLGDIVYSDTDRPAQPFISSRYGLVGKPDYVVMHNGVALPVEVKPNRDAAQPYESDRLQAAAYCLLLEETNAKAPPFAVLRYRSAVFRVDYDADLRAELLRLLSEVRAAAGRRNVPRSHQDVQRCQACGFRRSCEESLTR